MTIANALIAQGDTEAVRGDPATAARLYRRVLTEHSDNAVLVKIADAEYHAKNFAAAIVECDRSIALDVNTARAHTIRGLAKLELGDKPGAKADLKAAVKLGEPRAKSLLGGLK